MSKTWRLKTIFILAATLVLSVCGASAQQAASAEGPLRFNEMVYNFGKIPQGKPVYYTFKMTNTGSKPLKIENVHASCGCTTPEWSRDEVAAGAQSQIKVGYNAAAEGAFEKTITVSYAGQTQVLRIQGEVWKAPTTSAPLNPSVSFLRKQLQQ